MMTAFQERVVQEQIELDTKVEKLHAFIEGSSYRSLPPDEQSRLVTQYGIMLSYSKVLGERIAHFQKAS